MSKAKDLAGLVSTGGILSDGTVNLASEVTGTLPIASGGTGTTSTTFANLTTNVTGTLPIANGGTNATTADGALTALGGTTVGTSVFKAVDAAAARTALGAELGTVTSVGGTGTVNGLSLSGTVTTSGNLTLGGTLSGVDLTSQVTGTLPVANGGTGLTSVGSNGQVLASTGTGLNFVTPSTGAMTFISTLNVTNGAIQWTGLSGYNDYVIVLDSLKYSAFELVLVQFGTGAGPTWVTSGYMYLTNFMATFSFGTWQGTSSTGDSGINISQKNADGQPVSPMIGQVYVSNMLSTSSTDSRGVTFQGGYSGGSGRYLSLISTGFVTGISAAITGIRLLNSGGTFTGKVSLYGIKNT